MTRFHFTKPTFIFVTTFVMLASFVTSDTVAQESLSSMSGRVINPSGEPIAGVFLALASSRSETDAEGQFVLNNIPPRQAQLHILQFNLPKNSLRIRVIKFGKVSVYYHDPDPSDAVLLSIKPGTNLKNVEVITEYQLKIQGRIVFKNGEPLARAFLKINIDSIPLDWTKSFSASPSFATDAQGNFVYYAYSPGVYALSVNYRGLSAELEPFLLEEGKKLETQVLTLNGNSVDLSEPLPVEPKNKQRNVPDVKGMWIINPANGHVYKWIQCDDRTDAEIQAEKEDAHLVTITSEAEQIWLEAVFGTGPYWIGLSDEVEEGKWQWDTGERVTYTNWGAYEDGMRGIRSDTPALLKFFGFKDEDQRREEEMQDYAIMSARHWVNELGKWLPTYGHFSRHGKPDMAIIEKEGN